MELTKFSHACVRLAGDGGTLVVDPGSFSEWEAVADVDAVLITHEHPDHLDAEKLTEAARQQPELSVYAHPDVVAQLPSFPETVHVLEARPGDMFTAAGVQVRVTGGAHAVIHRDIPRIANVGYLFGDVLYHPGDSVDPADLPPDARVETLLLPVNAPWAKIAESVDFARALAPRRAYALHDFLLSEAGGRVYDANLHRLTDTEYTRLTPGTTVTI